MCKLLHISLPGAPIWVYIFYIRCWDTLNYMSVVPSTEIVPEKTVFVLKKAAQIVVIYQNSLPLYNFWNTLSQTLPDHRRELSNLSFDFAQIHGSKFRLNLNPEIEENYRRVHLGSALCIWYSLCWLYCKFFKSLNRWLTVKLHCRLAMCSFFVLFLKNRHPLKAWP